MATATTTDHNGLLRFTTAGSVDDGKSTLIGRLLYDSKSIFEDQLEAVESASSQKGIDGTDLSLLTDGLKAEREQGITIDVAYRYFATPKRKFIIADTPGHIQYTRNMVTGASTADLAIILIDARHGLLEQTHRHSFIASLLGLRHVVVCVNKMDLVDYSEDRFNEIVAAYKDFSSRLDITDIKFIPISALHGDNVVDRSDKTPWYGGGTLLHHLETVHVGADRNLQDCRFPVQYVIRPQTDAHRDFRGYAGRIASGVWKPGDKVVALPSGKESTIDQILVGDAPLDKAFPPLSVTMTLTTTSTSAEATCWFGPTTSPRAPKPSMPASVGSAKRPSTLRRATSCVTPRETSRPKSRRSSTASTSTPSTGWKTTSPLASTTWRGSASKRPPPPHRRLQGQPQHRLIHPRRSSTHLTVAAGVVG